MLAGASSAGNFNFKGLSLLDQRMSRPGRLPVISGRECAKALGKTGFYFKRQEGSHIVMRRNVPFAQIVVPEHKELDRGTLRAIIKQVGLNVNEFTELL